MSDTLERPDGFADNLDGVNGLVTASALYGRVDNDTLVPVKVDGSTQDIQMIEHEHTDKN